MPCLADISYLLDQKMIAEDIRLTREEAAEAKREAKEAKGALDLERKRNEHLQELLRRAGVPVE